MLFLVNKVIGSFLAVLLQKSGVKIIIERFNLSCSILEDDEMYHHRYYTVQVINWRKKNVNKKRVIE